MKKRNLYVLGTALVSVVAFMLASCSADDDFVPSNADIDIDSQVPLTRAGIDVNTDPNHVNYQDGECCLKTLIELKKKKTTFTEDNTAQDYYDRLKSKAVEMDKKNHPNDGYTGEGQMPVDLFVSVAQDEDLLDSEASNKKEYVNAKAVMVEEYNTQTGQWENHVGKVISVKTEIDEDGQKVAKSITYDSDKGIGQRT